jgi:hypothetical protein
MGKTPVGRTVGCRSDLLKCARRGAAFRTAQADAALKAHFSKPEHGNKLRVRDAE